MRDQQLYREEKHKTPGEVTFKRNVAEKLNTSPASLIYLVKRMNGGETAESSDSEDLCQIVRVHDVMDRLVLQHIRTFKEQLGQEPVCLRVTGKKDGVLLGGLLLKLKENGSLSKFVRRTLVSRDNSSAWQE